MKKKLLCIGSYILVAALAAAITLTVFARQEVEISKLDQLEALIGERFIGESDPEVLEDAAADAMVNAPGDRWSYYIPASQ